MAKNDGLDPFTLVPGRSYLVEFDDCCVNGSFTGEFVQILNPGHFDHSGDPTTDYEAVVFSTGQVAGWAVTIREVRK